MPENFGIYNFFEAVTNQDVEKVEDFNVKKDTTDERRMVFTARVKMLRAMPPEQFRLLISIKMKMS